MLARRIEKLTLVITILNGAVYLARSFGALRLERVKPA